MAVLVIGLILGGCAGSSKKKAQPPKEQVTEQKGTLSRTFTIVDEEGRNAGTLSLDFSGGAVLRDENGNVIGNFKPVESSEAQPSEAPSKPEATEAQSKPEAAETQSEPQPSERPNRSLKPPNRILRPRNSVKQGNALRRINRCHHKIKDDELGRELKAKLIQKARERIWIASPYFVPDGQVLSKKVEDMLNEDFSRSRTVELTDYTQRSFFFKLAVRSARLLAPIL